jgi:hypothetical protein
VIALTLAEPPPAAIHWTGAAMAKAAGISVSLVQRNWLAHDLQPHRWQFKLSNDSQLAAKLKDRWAVRQSPDHAIGGATTTASGRTRPQLQTTSTRGVRARARRVAGRATSNGSASHAGA